MIIQYSVMYVCSSVWRVSSTLTRSHEEGPCLTACWHTYLIPFANSGHNMTGMPWWSAPRVLVETLRQSLRIHHATASIPNSFPYDSHVFNSVRFLPLSMVRALFNLLLLERTWWMATERRERGLWDFKFASSDVVCNIQSVLRLASFQNGKCNCTNSTKIVVRYDFRIRTSYTSNQ
jgi:hypothetical protein